jgi:glycosyltransferase involved in cell wall biosynthesis
VKTRKIKVLQCIRQGQIGGGESHLLSLVENIDRSKFDPTVLSFTDGPMIDRLHQMKVPAHVIFTKRPFDFRKWKQLKSFISESGVDVIHAHGTRANSNVFWAARSLKIPVIYTVHGWSFHQDQHPLIRHLRIFGERYLTNRSSLNISVSHSNQESGKKYLPSFKSVVINNGIDQQKFDPARSFKNIREELNIGQEKILILFIARFTSHKQPLSLFEAFRKAVQSNSEMHLLMVGDGDQKKLATSVIQESGLQDKVTLLPFRQDVPDLLAAADIFVLPSLWEGLPIGLLEAMAMGKPVIATNVDGTKEIVIDNVNGLLIETTNLVENLTSALLKLSGDKKLRAAFSKQAVDTVSTNYNAVFMTRKIEALYNELTKTC